MSIKRLLKMTCKYEELANDDNVNEYGLSYKSPDIIKCFRYDSGASFGKISFDIKEDEIINNATKTYNVIDKRVKEGDRIDGRIVKVVDTHYDIHGNFSHKTCAVI